MRALLRREGLYSSPLTEWRAARERGELRAPFRPAERYEAAGEIDESATRATYRVPRAGVEMIQRTAFVAEGLQRSQATPWSRAHVLLQRAS